MCGIIGRVGDVNALPTLLAGLEQLEYRGYDSAGVALLKNNVLEVVKAKGRISDLRNVLRANLAGNIGIAHTRWATHGEPNERNAHPHTDCTGRLALVHNGIIENYEELKRELEGGHTFVSETDTEVLAHLIEDIHASGASLENAFTSALKRVRGTFGVAMISLNDPLHLYAARLGSPIVIGASDVAHFVASDPSAIMEHTRNMLFLLDGEYVVLEKNAYRILKLDHTNITRALSPIEWSVEDAKKNGHEHFMHKEMFEQPEVIENSIRGRLIVEEGMAHLGGLADVADRLRELDRLIIVACGSAYYAGLIGEYMMETIAGIPVEVELASEFRYREPIITRHTAVLAVSQSGETADTLAAIREAKAKGALTLGIVNVPGSTISRETDAGVYNHAGPEIGVASTKAFLSQTVIFALLSLFLGRQRGLSKEPAIEIAKAMTELPKQIHEILDTEEHIKEIAAAYANMKGCFYLGRKFQLPVAYEGALKLKEISYIHAEGYSAGEMKHGPLALVDETFPSIVLAPSDALREKTKSNIQEIRARRGPVIAVVDDVESDIVRLAHHVMVVPKTIEALSPILTTIPLQLFAYHVSLAKGFDPDKPRNLAKSVTVE